MRPAVGIVVVSGVLFLSSPAFAEEPKGSAPPPESAGKAAPRMIVVKDPETGQIRPAAAKEIEALKAASPAPKLATSGQPTTVERLSSGAVRARLGPEYMRYSVVRKNPDGSISGECVPPSKADAAVNAPASKAGPTSRPAAEEK